MDTGYVLNNGSIEHGDMRKMLLLERYMFCFVLYIG